MEYCSLGDLSVFIKKRGSIFPIEPLTIQGPYWIREPIIRHFLKQLGSAMEFLNTNHLIHRDLKPQNILLSPGERFNPKQPYSLSEDSLPLFKLADFGFARALPMQSLASTMCGSPLYMAPEILRGGKYDAKCDLWSIGAILFEMVYGRTPFKAQNHIDLIKKIERGDGIMVFPGEDHTHRTDPMNEMPFKPTGFPGSVNIPDSSNNRLANTAIEIVAEDLRDLMRKLLCRNPSDRIPFPEFFNLINHSNPSNSKPIDTQKTVTSSPIPSISISPIINAAPDLYSSSLPINKIPRRPSFNNNMYSTSSSPTNEEPVKPFSTFNRIDPIRKKSTEYPTRNINFNPPTNRNVRNPSSFESDNYKPRNPSFDARNQLYEGDSRRRSVHREKSQESLQSPIQSSSRQTSRQSANIFSFTNLTSITNSLLTKLPFFTNPEKSISSSDDYVFIEKNLVQVNLFADQMIGSQSYTKETPKVFKEMQSTQMQHVKFLFDTFSQCGLKGLCIEVLAQRSPNLTAEESFGLYYICLGLYQQTINIAKVIYDEQAKHDETNNQNENKNETKETIETNEHRQDHSSTGPLNNEKKNAINENMGLLKHGVDWIRNHFNTCLEMCHKYKELFQDEHISRPSITIIYDTFLDISQYACLCESNKNMKEATDGYQRSILLLEAILSCRTIFHETEDSIYLMSEEEYIRIEQHLRDLHSRLDICRNGI